MDNTNCLTAQEMAVVGAVFKNCIETEIVKYSAEQTEKINIYILNLVNSTKLHTLFSPAGLKSITEEVFNDNTIRDFVLCLTDQFNCIIALSDFEERSIQYSIGYGLNSPSFAENDYILIPQRIYENMELSGDLIFNILCANRWLLTLVLIYIFFGKIDIINLDLDNNVTPVKK